jgi:hypothetical protein
MLGSTAREQEEEEWRDGWGGAREGWRRGRDGLGWRRAHGIDYDEIFSLNAGVVQFPTTWKERTVVSPPRNVSLLSPQIMQRFHFY